MQKNVQMKACQIKTPHDPHCSGCDGPISIWFYEDIKPGALNTAAMCQAFCQDVIPCDGGLTSAFGPGRTLDRRSSINQDRMLLEEFETRANQCLVQPGCPKSPIDAHTVPDNWMRAIDRKHVYLFRPYAASSGPPDRLPKIPHKVSIRRATTAGFACREHDSVFQPADQRTRNLTKRRRLNLLFYRAMLKALNRELLADEVSRTHFGPIVESIVPGDAAHRSNRMRILKYASGLLRQSFAYPVLNWRIKHISKSLPGSPRIACSAAGDWVEHWVDILKEPARAVESDGVWGITIMPTDDGHLSTLHYCTIARSRYEAEHHLSTMEREVRIFEESQGIEFEEAVSAYAIALAEDLCIGTSAWESYPEARKELIKRAWTGKTWIPNGEFGKTMFGDVPEHETPKLNLFR